jgi:hypothetical protein
MSAARSGAEEGAVSELTAKQIAHGCKHFNGIQHDTCESGVAYKQFLYKNYDKFPCHPKPDGTLTGACPHFEFSTPEELEAEDRRLAESVKKWVEARVAHICPECGQSTLPEEQVGRCVYGACGHRLYQGKLGAL